ncbi:hypothetical protein I316_03860 [Kwoniella heveanensis BCC8398]|uniref:Integral membrane protein n=1 Tax=Kwoniella heveanensis BCC8398 TaxID=1296120 RepID=A0A1B9GTK2_9TREE|nr:hypothetical protein I316_03860 [Kwoniella heveanensis BCC8398]
MGGVSSALDPARGRGVISVPDGYTTPSFPSLYIPTIDSTIEQRGIFLYEAEAIWHFTLYWTMALLCGLFLICALFASATMILNLTVYRPPPGDPPDYPSRSKLATHHLASTSARNNLESGSRSGAGTAKPPPIIRKNLRKRRKKRPPLWPVLILPAVSVFVAAVIALISGTVVGFALAAIYSAGGFSMSTWVPFLWALIQVLVLIISSYSTLTSIL